MNSRDEAARRPLWQPKLIDARDDIFVAKNLVVATFMAAQALGRDSNERAALCAVANAAREALEAALARLDQVIAAAK